jgi:hypothetical protein
MFVSRQKGIASLIWVYADGSEDLKHKEEGPRDTNKDSSLHWGIGGCLGCLRVPAGAEENTHKPMGNEVWGDHFDPRRFIKIVRRVLKGTQIIHNRLGKVIPTVPST